MERVFNTFNSEITNSYIYAPRLLNLICRLDYARKDISQSSAIIDYFSKKDRKIFELYKKANLKTWQDHHEFIQNNINLFIPLAKKEYLQYQKYLQKNIKKNGNIGIVDTITARFSSQKLIEFVLGTKYVGFYWAVLKGAYEGVFKYHEFIKENKNLNDVFTKNWNFMEFLMTAPEYPIKQLKADGTPIYDENPSESEQIRKQIYPYISDGALDFAKDIYEIFNGADIYINGSMLVAWVNCFIDVPNQNDYKYMAKIQHAGDSNHKEYLPLFSVSTPLYFILFHPVRAMKKIRKAMWRTWFQTILLCISSPIKIRIHGLRIFRVLLFPKLKYRYFDLMLRFTKKHVYEISIGKPKEL